VWRELITTGGGRAQYLANDHIPTINTTTRSEPLPSASLGYFAVRVTCDVHDLRRDARVFS
jgi:hypothetical protein